MSEESPPTYTTSIFNQANFGTAAEGLDTAYLNSHYLRYPTAQTGLETIANLATTNDATINGLTVGTGSGSGIENTAIGESALASATTAAQNTAVGHEALYATTTGGTQTAVGFHAARNATGTNNTAIGYRAFRGIALSNSGVDNVAIGSSSVFNGGTRAIGIGVEALYNGGGVDCVAVGYKALHENPGANNTSVGNNALNATTGTNNTGIGTNAGNNNTTGSNNTYVGYNALPNATNYSNSTALGAGATITASNQVVLGTTTETVVIPNQINFNYTSNPTLAVGSLGYVYSYSVPQTLNIAAGAQITIASFSNVPVGIYSIHIVMATFDYNTTTISYVLPTSNSNFTYLTTNTTMECPGNAVAKFPVNMTFIVKATSSTNSIVYSFRNAVGTATPSVLAATNIMMRIA